LQAGQLPKAGMEMTTDKTLGLPVYWLLFFLICCGLGYPTLARFDARQVNVDAVEYFRLVTDTPSAAGDLLRYRVLVPWVAKPFYWLSQGRIRSWNPVFFGLLISNSLFTASGACLLLRIGQKCIGAQGVAFAGTLLYLLDFTIPNRQLGCGLVDSGESCFMLALFWLLLERKFFLLPALGLLGAFAKESFVPMSAMATAGWAICEYRGGRWRLKETIWALTMVIVGLSTVVVLQWSVAGRLIWPWEFAGSLRAGDSLLRGLAGCVTDRYFWYTFGWLVPLGVIRLKRLPAAWICAALGGAAAALAMGAWNSAGGNTVPSVFNSLGPILSLSAAHLLACGESRVQSSAATH
jgi:hypothetical protein